MPTFEQCAVSPAPPEEVWKLLYDPARFPEWWAGIGSVETEGTGRGYTMFPDGYPDFPMPQALETSQEHGTVRISCLVSDLRFDWRLRPDGTGTQICVQVEIPDAEAHRLDGQRDVIRQSLGRLADLAEAGGTGH
jgi:uncharacterized protein YndB with AHSA1/START domain